MAKEELKVISDCYDFIVWLTNHTQKFPRNHRYSLGIDMERQVRGVLALLIKAKYHRQKEHILHDVNVELELLRFQLRLAKDLEVINVRSHGHGAKVLQEIGQQIGGWLKGISKR
jgi:hypothetical protein